MTCEHGEAVCEERQYDDDDLSAHQYPTGPNLNETLLGFHRPVGIIPKAASDVCSDRASDDTKGSTNLNWPRGR